MDAQRVELVKRARQAMALFILANQRVLAISEEAYFLDVLKHDDTGAVVRDPPGDGQTVGPITTSLETDDCVSTDGNVDPQEFLEALEGLLGILNGVDPEIVKKLYRVKASLNTGPVPLLPL